MAKSIKVNQKKRGRPATGRDPVSAVRLPAALTADVDKWAEDHEANRSEAIRRLVELALGIAQRAGVRTKKAAKAAEMASEEIDRLGDVSATDEERQLRKRRLIKGPKEFRDLRRNRPKANG